MKLKKLITGLPITVYKGGLDVEITGLCAHSRCVGPGNLFIAKKGSVDDGAKYIEEALSAGATAILTDLPNPFLKGIVQLVHPFPERVEGALASRFYQNPSQELYVVGVTGTNGKTTTTYLVKHLLDQLGSPCGLIGTIEYLVGSYRFEADRTTPDAITNQKLHREMVKQGCKAVAMEVSSHGLAQGRCDQIDFDAAVFTNLSQDHLDYHHTMEIYAQEKAKLFTSLSSNKTAIINNESHWKDEMIANCRAKILTYGFTPECCLYADELYLSPSRSAFTIHYQGQKVRFVWDLIGRYNILNCLAAVGVCLSKKIPLAQLSAPVESFPGVCGRLEKVENRRGLNMYVDYAHTPDALEKVLNCLQELKQGRIITVFGCGGDRDKTKRPQMGKAAEKGSDFTIVTSDNPRSENPRQICEEIATGFSTSDFKIVTDRRLAIEQAIQMATVKDLILIAGKGHETYQLFSHQTLPFDDKKISQEIANRVSA